MTKSYTHEEYWQFIHRKYKRNKLWRDKICPKILFILYLLVPIFAIGLILLTIIWILGLFGLAFFEGTQRGLLDLLR